MVYSSEEKARMDRLVGAFSEYIAVSPEFDIAYTEKSGYLWLVIAEDAERIYFPIRSFDKMLDMLFHDVLFEHISRLPEPLTEEKSWKAGYEEVCNLLQQILSQLEADREHSLHKLEKSIAYWAVSPLLP